ncbi:MAG: hypothetical protein Q8M26_04565 [Pseudolabrys sp.]|nr:hypothetical protein [Pseudolabrys sp.]
MRDCRLIAGLLLASLLAATPAAAETKLGDLAGTWTGRGTDRDTPMATAQPTQCRARVTADQTRLTSDMTCNGQAGLMKQVRLAVTLRGTRFTGTAEQTSSTRGSNAAPKRRSGTVTGTRRGDTAVLTVRFPGLTPNATVTMELTSPTSFGLTVSTLGSTLTRVDFTRPR